MHSLSSATHNFATMSSESSNDFERMETIKSARLSYSRKLLALSIVGTVMGLCGGLLVSWLAASLLLQKVSFQWQGSLLLVALCYQSVLIFVAACCYFLVSMMKERFSPMEEPTLSSQQRDALTSSWMLLGIIGCVFFELASFGIGKLSCSWVQGSDCSGAGGLGMLEGSLFVLIDACVSLWILCFWKPYVEFQENGTNFVNEGDECARCETP